MKILVFAPYYPPHIGGVEKYTEELHKAFADAGHKVTVFAPCIPETAAQTEQSGGVEILRYRAFEIIANYPLPKLWSRDYLRLVKVLRERQFDIVMSHTRFFFSSFLALRFSASNGLPLLHVEHGSSFVRNGNPFTSFVAWAYDRLVGTRVLNGASTVVAVSHAVSTFIDKLTSGAVQPTVIYRGFDWDLPETIQADDSAWPTQEASTPRIISIGRLIPSKGISDLLSALAALSDRPWQCLIVGDGPERARLEAQCKRQGLEENVRFLGALPHEAALKILKSADIFVNPSYSEGLPTTVVEAAIFGKAIIATDVGGTNEIITHGHNGLLVPAHDIDHLASAISSLLDDSTKTHRIGSFASADNQAKFERKRSADQFTELLNKLLR
jgi:glycosyltransferase involved in cell wall biosynthesis